MEDDAEDSTVQDSKDKENEIDQQKNLKKKK